MALITCQCSSTFARDATGRPSPPWSRATMSNSDGLQLDPWPRNLQLLILVSTLVTPWQLFTF